MAQLDIQLLGLFRASRSGAPLTGFDSDKVRALLAYLAIESERSHRREKLAGLLWPEFSERAARTNLRRGLSNLRHVISDQQADPPYLLITRKTIQFNQSSDYALDVKSFTSLLSDSENRPSETSQLENAVALYQGDFLEGFSIPDSAPFEEWALITRESLRYQINRILFRLSIAYEKQGICAYERALQLVRRLVTLDPYQEAAHQQLMQLLAFCGQRNEALAHYEKLAQLLNDELGIMPSAQTREVHKWLLAQDGLPPAAVMDVAQPDTQSNREREFAKPHAQNLPAQMTRFVGRQREIAEIQQLLSKVRLLTLIGPPGTGKSRLALEATSRLIDKFSNGVFFVNLAPISDPDIVTGTIAQVLGLKETTGRVLQETLKNYLRNKHLLLLLDNFEHIIDAAPLVNDLLIAAPDLKILITSRQPLQIYGEQEYLVSPLAVPDLNHPQSLQDLSQNDSIELFIQHAQAVRPGFVMDDVNARDVAEICVHLDGLPLAIELAAARIKLYSPEMIRTHLGDRFNTLTGGSRYLPDRLRTLRAAINWSYDLLNEEEKLLFARLSVFQGGRSMEAVEAICSQDLHTDTFNLLESLLNKSLLQQHAGTDGEPRFVMLETIHEYARECLEDNAEAESIQKRHADYFVALAEKAEAELSGPEADAWCARLQIEMDNLRTALTWTLANDEAHSALRLASALRDYWYNAGYSVEGLKWISSALAAAGNTLPDLRAKALNAAGMLEAAKEEYKQGEDFHREALDLSRKAGDKLNQAWALVFLGWDVMDRPAMYKAGLAYCQEGLSMFQALDYKPGLIQALDMIGELSRLTGDYEQARQVYQECIAECRQSGHKVGELSTLGNLAFIANHQGDFDRALALGKVNLTQFYNLGLRYHIVADIAVLVGTFSGLGKQELAARLLGAVDALFESMGASLKHSDKVELERYADSLRQELDRQTFEMNYAAGKAMTLDETVSWAMGQYSK